MGILHFFAQDKNFEKISWVKKFNLRWFWKRIKENKDWILDGKQTYGFRITKGMRGFA
jgi:hypothetical protein